MCLQSYFSYNIAIEYLENFIKTKFTKPLHRITNKSGCPSFGKTSNAFFSNSKLESITKTLIFDWINLDATFYKIKRYNASMS